MEPFQTQVVVVGSGPAGAEVATRLARLGRKVLVLDSGADAYDADAQSLSNVEHHGRPHRIYTPDAEFHSYLSREYRGLNRIRQLGGTSVAWTGKWRMFPRPDIEGREWVPMSRWPLDYETLRAAYAEVAADYGIGAGPGAALPEELEEARRALEAGSLETSCFFDEAAPYRSAERLLNFSDRLDIVLDATVIRIELEDGADRVAALIARSRSGRELRVQAEHVVLATGGLETPRILLLSNQQRSAGLGNGHDLVGRFYQDHLKLKTTLYPGPLMTNAASAFRIASASRVSLCLALPLSFQKAEGVLGSVLFLRPRYDSAAKRALNRLLQKRAPFDGVARASSYAVTFAMEQAVDAQSRVRLGDARDAFGLRRLAVDWRLNPLDRRSFDVSLREYAALARRSGLGEVGFCRDPEGDWAKMSDAAHHIGTTRMGATPREGVVDPNCALFEAPNLHVASSAVFPTGAAYSPTYTILALARRLANRLDAILAQPVKPGIPRGGRVPATENVGT